jgi:beta-galactosidase/beta-glucuronidase
MSETADFRAVSEHPLPQAARERWLSLDGAWQSDLGEITVPFAFEAALSGIGKGAEVHERLRYRRTFRVPDGWDRTLLRFGGVDWRAEVSVDGEHVGSHEGGYAHFSFELGALEPGSEHELVVDVFDPADDAFGQAKGKQRGSHGIWYTRTTGIWRSVWIESVPETYIRDFSTPGVTTTIRAGGEIVASGTGDVRVDNPRLWSPDDPFLYDVELTLGDDRVTSYVGYRTIEARGRELLLNGEPLRVAGVLDQGFWPDGIYTPPSADALRADVEAAKALGFNLARKHVKIEDPRWYAWCDRLGLLVAQDMPSSHDLSTDDAQERFAREWTEVVGQLRLHPSIVMWIPINEDWGEPAPAFQRELVDLTRAADPTRLVVDASGWKQQLDHTDLVDVHDYGTELEQHRKHAAAGIPVWIGECGGISLAVEGHSWTADFSYRDVHGSDELADGYRRLVEQVPADVAGFVWTQLTDVEGELNGLLTYDRLPKCAFQEIRTVNEEFRNG